VEQETMKDDMERADKIINELLARDGAMSRERLRAEAIEAMREAGELHAEVVNGEPTDPTDRLFLKHQMIVIAAKDDAEADALLARAHGMEHEPVSAAEVGELDEGLKRAAVEAIEGMAKEVSRNRRGGSSVH
jgi:hypothetical protein